MSVIHCVKEDTFFELLSIPSHKPPMLKLVKCDIASEVSEYKMVDTPRGRSFEGDYLTGLNLMVLITLTEEITYISATPAQTVHAIHYTFLKNIILTLPEDSDPNRIKQMIHTGHFELSPSIASIHTQLKSSTCLAQNILIKLDFNTY